MFNLSLASFFNAYTFILLGLYILKTNRKELLNRLAAMVLFCFALWSFACTFFYMAPTVQTAWFWHKLSAIGWILYCPFATHFFLQLAEKLQKQNFIQIFLKIYLLPVILVLVTVLGPASPAAKGFIQSTTGLGWTFITNIDSIWFWIYCFYIPVSLSIALYFIYKWAKNSMRQKLIKLATGIIILDVLSGSIAFFTDLILPLFAPLIPPVFNILNIVWGITIYYIINSYRLMNVYDATTPAMILETVMDPILMLDNKGFIDNCNQATAALLKYEPSQIIGKPLIDFYKSEQYERDKIDLLLENKLLRNSDFDLIDAYGNTIHTIASFSVTESKLGEFVGVLISFHDVTQYKELASSLEKMANSDKLTDLPNRRMFFARLEAALEHYRLTGEKFALVYIDLDGFKSINDSYGHDIGDKALKKVADLLIQAIRKQDMIARIGGDEFILIFADLEQESKLDQILLRIREIFAMPIQVDILTCRIGVSMGISRCPEDGTTSNELIKVADARMYMEKNR